MLRSKSHQSRIFLDVQSEFQVLLFSPIGSNGLGITSVNGLNLVPSPATLILLLSYLITFLNKLKDHFKSNHSINQIDRCNLFKLKF